jgi:hypothetical protein
MPRIRINLMSSSNLQKKIPLCFYNLSFALPLPIFSVDFWNLLFHWRVLPFLKHTNTFRKKICKAFDKPMFDLSSSIIQNIFGLAVKSPSRCPRVFLLVSCRIWNIIWAILASNPALGLDYLPRLGKSPIYACVRPKSLPLTPQKKYSS